MISDVEVGAIVNSLQLILDPLTPDSQRKQALTLCESFKSHPKCAHVGFYLANQNIFPSSVRYFGLQLIYNHIRLRWTELYIDEQSSIKAHILMFISGCPETLESFVKLLASSILCEIIKHVWPQEWTTMLPDVASQVKNNASGTEIVEQMLSSLAEDVVLFQNIQNKVRARDLRQALTVTSPDIMNYLVDNLTDKIARLSQNASPLSTHQITVTIKVLTNYVEWVNIDLIFKPNPVFLELIFQLLTVEAIQLPVSECLAAIVNRKGHIEERKKILFLTSDHFIERLQIIFEMFSAVSDLNENRLKLLRNLAQILTVISNLIINVWTDDEKNNPSHRRDLQAYKKMFEVVYLFTTHPSRFIASAVFPLWSNLLRNKEVRKDAVLLSTVPTLLQLISRNLCKGLEDSLSTLEEMEFNDDDEWLAFRKHFRALNVELLRFCTCALPLNSIEACFEFMRNNLTLACSSLPELYLKWEGVQQVADIVTGSAVMAAADRFETNLIPISDAVDMFSSLLTRDTNDAVILRCVLNCCYSLLKLIFLSDQKAGECLTMFISKIFFALDSFTNGAKNLNESSLRRVCSALLIRLSKNHPRLMLVQMEYFKSLVLERFGKVPCMLSPYEKVAMLESLILVSGEWNNFASQSHLIKDTISTANYVVESASFQTVLKTPMDLAREIGLTSANDDKTFAETRSNLYYYVALTQAVLSRSSVPSSPDLQKTGGFIGKDGLMNPCNAHICPAIDHILTLVQNLSFIWSEEMAGFVHAGNKKSLEIKDSEKLSLIRTNAEAPSASCYETEEKKHWQKLQNFLLLTLDNCYQILGLASKVIGPNFYAVTGLQAVIVDKCLNHMTHLPIMRLKSLLRLFLVNFLKYCPPCHASEIICPILQTYCDFMLNRIKPAWERYSEKESSRLNGHGENKEGDGREEQEIVEEQLLRVITREHLDLLVNLCINKQPPTNKPSENNALKTSSLGGLHVSQLTDIGVIVSKNPACEAVVNLALSALSWLDTSTCFKATQLLWPVLKLLLTEQGDAFTETTTRHIFESILLGLSKHGQHDGCEAQLSAMALMFIQSLHSKHYHVFLTTLETVSPDSNAAEIANFLTKFDSTNDKKRKVFFKKKMAGFIQRHVSQQFRLVPKMNELSPLFLHKKSAKKENDEKTLSFFGLADLFQ